MTPTTALLVVLAVIVVIAVFGVLAHALGLTETWAGFLWLFYWASIEQARMDRVPATLLGAATGLSTALALQLVPQLFGMAGLAVVLLVMAGLVYCLLLKWLPTFVNNACMLFLTVATIPHLQLAGNFVQMYTGLLAGMVFFGGVIQGVAVWVSRIKGRA